MNLKDLRKEHYKASTLFIDQVHRREIAFARNGELKDRANYFATMKELTDYLSNSSNITSVYASMGYYQDPNVFAINKRGHMGADLAFDVDLKPTGSRLDWMYDVCAVTSNVIERLVKELGFKREEMTLDFSGGKGFHITINNSTYRDLTKKQRNSLVEYLKGVGVDRKSLEARKGGWNEHYTNFLSNLSALMTDDTKQNYNILLAHELPKVHAKKISDLATKPDFRQNFATGRFVGLSAKAVYAIQSAFMRTTVASYEVVDSSVTGDLNRLLRVAGTIHGSSGFVSTRLDLDDINDPEVIFTKIKQAGGLDLVEITLDEPKVEDFDRVHEWPAGTHTVPRWLALHLLH